MPIRICLVYPAVFQLFQNTSHSIPHSSSHHDEVTVALPSFLISIESFFFRGGVVVVAAVAAAAVAATAADDNDDDDDDDDDDDEQDEHDEHYEHDEHDEHAEHWMNMMQTRCKHDATMMQP